MTMDPQKRSTTKPRERQIPLISMDPLKIEIPDNSKASFQPRDRAGLLSKQSAHTDSNLICITQLDTRIGLEPHPSYMKPGCFID